MTLRRGSGDRQTGGKGLMLGSDAAGSGELADSVPSAEIERRLRDLPEPKRRPGRSRSGLAAGGTRAAGRHGHAAEPA